MTAAIDATGFATVEAALIPALQNGNTGASGALVSNLTPSPIPSKFVSVGYAGGGFRDWGEASANAAVNVYAATENECGALVQLVQDDLAAASNDLIEGVQVPAGGGTSVPRQSPPFQRYFVVTVTLKGQSVL